MIIVKPITICKNKILALFGVVGGVENGVVGGVEDGVVGSVEDTFYSDNL